MWTISARNVEEICYDVFSVVKRESIQTLLDHINELDEQIEFTIQREEGGLLPFMDAAVRRADTGLLQTAVYRKPTHTDRVLNFFSHHSRSARAAVVHALLDRIKTHFADAEQDYEGRSLEKQRVFKTLLADDYPGRFIEHITSKRSRRLRRAVGGLDKRGESQGEERWITVPYVQGTSEAIATILRSLGIRVAHRASQWKWCVCAGILDAIPPESRNGVVYRVPCQDCQAVYVGETLRTLPTRLQEHQCHTQKGKLQGSAIAEHACSLQHQISWDEAGMFSWHHIRNCARFWLNCCL